MPRCRSNCTKCPGGKGIEIELPLSCPGYQEIGLLVITNASGNTYKYTSVSDCFCDMGASQFDVVGENSCGERAFGNSSCPVGNKQLTYYVLVVTTFLSDREAASAEGLTFSLTAMLCSALHLW